LSCYNDIDEALKQRGNKEGFAASRSGIMLMTDYTLVRTQRRTVAIYIRNIAGTSCAYVEVRAPIRMPKREIDLFVASKEKWITEHLALSQANAEKREAFALDYGDTAAFRGAPFPLVGIDEMSAGFNGERFYLPRGFTTKQVKSVIVLIYRRLAKLVIAARVEYYAGLMKMTPAAVKISGAKTRWGSCSGKKSLNFSWRLVMADDSVIDYVVVHELAHIAEMNHSARFWAIVAKILPDYKARQQRLKELQRRLYVEDWE